MWGAALVFSRWKMGWTWTFKCFWKHSLEVLIFLLCSFRLDSTSSNQIKLVQSRQKQIQRLQTSSVSQNFTISQVKVFLISCVPSVQITSVLAALRCIRGTVQSSWIWNICQEHSSGAMVHILTNQHWINSMYLHNKQLIQKKNTLSINYPRYIWALCLLSWLTAHVNNSPFRTALSLFKFFYLPFHWKLEQLVQLSICVPALAQGSVADRSRRSEELSKPTELKTHR